MPRRASPPGRPRKLLFALQLFVTGLVLASCGWVLADGAKRLWARGASGDLLPWAAPFHHPADSGLLPYVAACLVALAYGLFLYLRLGGGALGPVRWLRRTACGRAPLVLVVVLLGQGAVVSASEPAIRGLLAALSVAAALATIPPRLASAPGAAALGRAFRPPFSLLCGAGALALLAALAVEPIKIALRPVHLLNEYRDLHERFEDSGEASAPDGGLCEFLSRDPIEFEFQSTTRGPINHLGHVLNPVNEYETGKPLDRIYFQYGLGATFAFKWAMDLAGGPSVQAYYLSFLYYVLYWCVFVAAAAALLRDPRHVLVAVATLAAAYYSQGYLALVIAPGINPVLHLLDLPVLLVALRFFRTGRTGALALAALGAAGAVLMNGFFGPMIAVALAVSAGLYLLENAPPGRRARRLALAAAVIGVPIAAVALALPRSSGTGVKLQFLLGFFSWAPAPPFVVLAVAYLSATYVFLLRLRHEREPLKYAAVFLAVYVQGFFVYFFWSGLENHFWPVLPYVGLHVLLMIRLLGRRPQLARLEPWVVAAALVAAVALGKEGVDGFVNERALVRGVFAKRETHRWPFARARVISTADPAPLAEAVALLDRHAPPGDRGVYLLSVLDNLVPFLARRHSALPHFELQWSLLTEADRTRSVGELERARPAVLFVGREVERAALASDPWAGQPCAFVLKDERTSAAGRILELRRIFDAVSADYERTESGSLLSVYRRRDGR